MLIATRLWFSAGLVLTVLAMMAALVLWTITSMDRAVSGRLQARELLLQVGLVLRTSGKPKPGSAVTC